MGIRPTTRDDPTELCRGLVPKGLHRGTGCGHETAYTDTHVSARSLCNRHGASPAPLGSHRYWPLSRQDSRLLAPSPRDEQSNVQHKLGSSYDCSPIARASVVKVRGPKGGPTEPELDVRAPFSATLKAHLNGHRASQSQAILAKGHADQEFSQTRPLIGSPIEAIP